MSTDLQLASTGGSSAAASAGTADLLLASWTSAETTTRDAGELDYRTVAQALFGPSSRRAAPEKAAPGTLPAAPTRSKGTLELSLANRNSKSLDNSGFSVCSFSLAGPHVPALATEPVGTVQTNPGGVAGNKPQEAPSFSAADSTREMAPGLPYPVSLASRGEESKTHDSGKTVAEGASASSQDAISPIGLSGVVPDGDSRVSNLEPVNRDATHATSPPVVRDFPGDGRDTVGNPGFQSQPRPLSPESASRAGDLAATDRRLSESISATAIDHDNISSLAFLRPSAGADGMTRNQDASEASQSNQATVQVGLASVPGNIEQVRAAISVLVGDSPHSTDPVVASSRATGETAAPGMNQASSPVLLHATTATKATLPPRPWTKFSKTAPTRADAGATKAEMADKAPDSAGGHVEPRVKGTQESKELSNDTQEGAPSTSQSHRADATAAAKPAPDGIDTSTSAIPPTSPSSAGLAGKADAPSINPGGPQQHTANVADANEVDDTQSPAGSHVNTAQLVQDIGQTEFRVGMHSLEFGSVDIRTSLAHHELTAQISVEHAGIARALEHGLSGLCDRLSDQSVPLTSIVIHNQSTSASSGQEQPMPQQKQAATQPEGAVRLPAKQTLPVVADLPVSVGRLDVRI